MRLIELTTMNQTMEGELVFDYPWVFEWSDRYDIRDCLSGRDHFALEAWERMTTGGVSASFWKGDIALPTSIWDNPPLPRYHERQIQQSLVYAAR